MLLAASTGKSPTATHKITYSQKVGDDTVINKAPYISAVGIMLFTMKVRGIKPSEIP